jgi:hypothetical protein
VGRDTQDATHEDYEPGRHVSFSAMAKQCCSGNFRQSPNRGHHAEVEHKVLQHQRHSRFRPEAEGSNTRRDIAQESEVLSGEQPRTPNPPKF